MTGIRLPDISRLGVDASEQAIKDYLHDLVRALQYEVDNNEQEFGQLGQIEALDSVELSSGGNIPRSAAVILCDASASNMTVSLPDPLDAKGEVYYIKKISTGNTVTLTCSTSGATIDKATSQILIGINYPTVKVYSDGSEYWII
jgi:hypothetical protein